MKIINSIDLLDVKVAKEFDKYAVDVSMESSIKDAVRSFQIGDIDAAHNFGRLEDTTDMNYLDNLLITVSSSSQGKKGDTLNEIVALAREVSNAVEPSYLQKKLSRIPYVGPYIMKAIGLHFSAMSRFDSVKGQIDILTSDIESISEGLFEMNKNIDGMYDQALTSVKNTGVNIVAAYYILEKLQTVQASIRKELKTQPDNTILSMEAMNIEHQIALITKRQNDMITEQQKAFEDLKMMKMMKFNNLSMVDQFETIIKVTIPSSKRSHLIIDQAERSDKSSLLIQAIGDSVNQQARRQALLVKESSIRVAKTANRTVYDVETIDYISNQINEAGREIKKIHDRAKTQHTQLEARAAQWKEKRFMVAMELSSK